MKHFEIIVEYEVFESEYKEEVKDVVYIDRRLNIRNYDLVHDVDERAVYKKQILSTKKLFNSAKENIIKKINGFLVQHNNENMSAFLVDWEDGYFTFISRVTDNYYKNVENVINKIINFIMDNGNEILRNSEYRIKVSNDITYKEISAKEFLIDDLAIDNNSGYFDFDDMVCKYMNSIKETNYRFHELCLKKTTLDTEFIFSYNIGPKLTKKQLVDKYNVLLFNEDLRNEIDRIYDESYNRDIKIKPVHYQIFNGDEKTRDLIYECLATALYSNDRIKNRIALKMKIDVNDNFVSNQVFDMILRAEADSFVILEFAENVHSKGSQDTKWSLGDRRFKEMADIIDSHKNFVQYSFFFDKYKKEMEDEMIENLPKINFLKINDNISIKDVDKVVENLLKNRNLKRNKRLDNMLKPAYNTDLSIKLIENIIDDWERKEVIKENYPIYEEVVNSCENIYDRNPYDEFKHMVGLSNVKKVFNQILMCAEIDKARKEKSIESQMKKTISGDISPIDNSLHMCFMGNPGTAKTTVAKLFAKILYYKGIIRSPKTIVYGFNKGSNLKDYFKLAYGGILFIDEAYQYANDESFLASLCEYMETYRNRVIVILAGYTAEMKYFISSNPGLESRIKYKIEFNDYSEEELWNILLNMLDGMELKILKRDKEEIKKKLFPAFSTSQSVSACGNGRMVRNILDTAKMRMAARLKKNNDNLKEKTFDDLTTLVSSDFDMDYKMILGVNILDISRNPKKEFKELIGLKESKDIIEKIIQDARISMIRNRNKKNISLIKSPMHLAFLGNPGTAKTTVARLFARILKKEGIINKPYIVEVGRKDLVAPFVGQTASLVAAQFEKAKGGVLFIDEAYSLMDGNGGYGEEAINAIVQEMENRRDEVIVIFAGYSDRMKEFFDKNEGMKSRINYFIEFSDYDYKSLYRIFEKIVRDKDFRIGNGVQKFLLSELSKLTKKKDFSSLGNGRYIRKLVEKSILNLNYRIGKLNKDKYSKAELFTIELCDIKNAMNDDIICNESKNGKIGFVA